MAVQTFNPTDLSQSTTNWAVAQRIIGPFAPHAQVSLDLTIALDPGYLLNGTTLTEVKAQVVGPFAPPSSGFRIDRVVVDRMTGTASVVSGTANSLTPPAIPTGKLPVARVFLDSTTQAIGNESIVDERAFSDTMAPAAPVVCRATLGGTDQPLPASTVTRVSFTATNYNVGSAFNTASQRFQPSTAGYYLVAVQLHVINASVGAHFGFDLHKNGTAYYTVGGAIPSNGRGYAVNTDTVYMNGATDYLEVFGFQNGSATAAIHGGSYTTWFTATRVA